LKQTGQEETRRRDRAGGVNTAATAAEQQNNRNRGQPQDFPIKSHLSKNIEGRPSSATTIFSFILGIPPQERRGGLTKQAGQAENPNSEQKANVERPTSNIQHRSNSCSKRMGAKELSRLRWDQEPPQLKDEHKKECEDDSTKFATKFPTRFLGRLHYCGLKWVFMALLLAGVARVARGAEPVQTNSAGTSLERRAYEEAKAAYIREPTNTVVAWKFARACFDLIDPGEKNPQRAKVAQEGIGAAEGALAQDSKSAPAHYYLAMNLGELARTKTFGALRLVSRMEREFLAAIEADEHFDHAGPERNLGTLYRDAPVIGSVGSRSKARQHLKRAVELDPDFPDNRMALLEAYVKWGEWDEARAQLKALDELWPRAKEALAGEAWVSSWVDWEARKKVCSGKVASHPPK
jgi:hypothetical protein